MNHDNEVNDSSRNNIACAEAATLLPWHVNGSLADRERTAVELHLADCPACAREVEFLAAIRVAMPATSRDTAPPFSRLLARINRQERKARAWKTAAGVALLIAGIVAIAIPAYLFEPRFHTVTEVPDTASNTVQLQLRFTDEAASGALPALLTRYDADIVSGPGASGQYMLEFRLDKGQSIDALKQQLRDEPGFVLLTASPGDVSRLQDKSR